MHKAMKKNSLKIVFVIDESGSMSGSESDVIGGFNGYVDKVIKDNPGEVVVSLYKFCDSVERVVANQKISVVKKLTGEDYVPGGFTALYDAIGQAVTDADGEVAALESEGKPDAVLFVIITDGQENASKVFTSAGVKALIATHERLLDWSFVYLGSGLENLEDADRLGIRFKTSSRKSNLNSNFCSMAEVSARLICFDGKSKEKKMEKLMEDLK
jgi:hypothetical protein